LQNIFNIAEICAQKEIRDIILSPGSRCAPLTLAFVRHPEIQTRTISDERSAAFIAIGISQQTKKTVGLVCTSGSAAYNYAPAVAEAYYQQIPLLILTADRPPEWIDQLDGQTIRQDGIYGKHVKKSYTLPVDHSHEDAKWEIERIVSEAINLTQEYPCGPVHINVPLREPLYPSSEIKFEKNIKTISRIEEEKILSDNTWEELLKEYKGYSKVMIVAGQSDHDESLATLLNSFAIKNNVPVVGDIISNVSKENIINLHDVILSKKDEALHKNLAHDLFITFGKSVISKNLKLFLRKQKTKHWHIQSAGYTSDTFQSLTKIIPVKPAYFFTQLYKKTNTHSQDKSYKELWLKEEKSAKEILKNFFNRKNSFNEFKAINEIIKNSPDHSILHLANSMPVRYANYIGLPEDKTGIEVFANRGTSGIDGVISTAVGAALSTDKIVTVITGDMAFFYDRNALWNNYLPSNLRIVILNNHGGGIFRIIDGPNRQPELDEYFETKQMLLAGNTAKDHNLEYSFCKDEKSLESALKNFFSASSRSKIMEIETDSKTNTEVFQNFKKSII
jgi:2-succinyl-5-enolpyruvyl-6-hydroxy-3-cyclohexene-1-carboxylate synthase